MARRAFFWALKLALSAILLAAFITILITRISKPAGPPPSIAGRWRELKPPDFD